MKKEEQLNTMDSFHNGFRIVRDGKIITLAPEEMSDFRFFDKAIEGRDNLYAYGCNKAKTQGELNAIAALASDPIICRNITTVIEDTLYEDAEEIEMSTVAYHIQKNIEKHKKGEKEDEVHC